MTNCIKALSGGKPAHHPLQKWLNTLEEYALIYIDSPEAQELAPQRREYWDKRIKLEIHRTRINILIDTLILQNKPAEAIK